MNRLNRHPFHDLLITYFSQSAQLQKPEKTRKNATNKVELKLKVNHKKKIKIKIYLNRKKT